MVRAKHFFCCNNDTEQTTFIGCHHFVRLSQTIIDNCMVSMNFGTATVGLSFLEIVPSVLQSKLKKRQFAES